MFDQGLYTEARDQLYAAKPRLFIESYLKIRDVHRRLVPMILTPNQLHYYDEVFTPLSSIDEAIRALFVKARKAESTSFWVAVAFAYASQIPIFGDVLIFADDEATAVFELSMAETFYNNLPDELRTGRKHRGQTFHEYSFGEHVPGPGHDRDRHDRCTFPERMSTSITVATARSRHFARSRTPKMVIFSEAAYYEENYEREVYTATFDSLPPNPWVIEESTPNGPRGLYYEHYKAMRDGEIAGKIIRRYWYFNPNDSLPADHALVRPADKQALDASSFSYTPEELALTTHFPSDSIPDLHRILWRRFKIADAIALSHNNEEAGNALFQQEHAENETDCWLGTELSPIPLTRRREMLELCRNPVAPPVMVKPGFWQRIWELPHKGTVYVGILDPAKGNISSDPTAFSIFDVTRGIEVAEIYGRCPLSDAVEACLTLLSKYQSRQHPIFVPEANGIGANIKDYCKTVSWPLSCVWRRRKHPGEDVESRSYQQRPWGFMTGSTMGKTEMFDLFYDQVRDGRIVTYNTAALQDWFTYDESRFMNRKVHTPDRAIVAAIFAVVRNSIALPEIFNRPGYRANTTRVLHGGGF